MVDADQLAHELIETRAGIRRALQRVFGSEVFDARGRLKRRTLGRRVFPDPEKRRVLNAIVWPPLLEAIRKRLRILRREQPDRMVVLDMAVLFESGADALADCVVFVHASRNRRLAWLAGSRGWSRAESIGRMAAQDDARTQRRRADVVVQNRGTREELRRKAAAFMDSGGKGSPSKTLAFRQILS